MFLELGILVSRLGIIGSNLWEPTVPRTGGPWFQDWEALVRTLGNQQFLELGTRAHMTSNSWESQFFSKHLLGQNSFYDACFLVFDVGLVNSCHMFVEQTFFLKHII